MGIGAHDNPELRDAPARVELAAGSSNSNSHNQGGGGGGGSVAPAEMRETLDQLSALLPRLNSVVERLEGGQ
jgi:hypothetical protein